MLSAHRLTPSLSADLLYQFPHRPQHFFLIKKSGSSHVDSKASELASYLRLTHRLTVYVEQSVAASQPSLFPDCVPYDPSHHRHTIDVVITLGGDGTALHFNSLFNDSHTIPMLLSFSLGTLGFLTPFDFGHYRVILSQLLKAYVRPTRNNHHGEGVGEREGEGEGDGEYVISLCPRMRLLCQVWKKKKLPHRESTAEERLAREAQRRRRRRMSHGISGDDDDSTSSEDDDAVDGEEAASEERSAEQVKADQEVDEREKQRVATIEARQCKVDRQRAVEQAAVQGTDASASSSTSADAPSSLPYMPDDHHVYLAATFHPLNEVLLSGHTNRSLMSIDLSLIQEDGKHQKVSTVLADALIVSTATGSTAYSMSAGGPMVSPNTHCIIITPVCPHSLSFRPLILPDSTHLLLSISDESRTRVGQIICDGVGGRKVRKGEWVTVRQDSVPVWSVNYVSRRRDQRAVRKERVVEEAIGDGDVEDTRDAQVDSSVLWFNSISVKLNWNTREGINGHVSDEVKDNAVDHPREAARNRQ